MNQTNTDNKNLTFGIKYCIVLNSVMLCIIVIFAVGFLMFSKEFIDKTQGYGIPVLIFIAGLNIIWIMDAVLLYIANRGLKQHKESAKSLQIFLSLIHMLLIPVGTILYGLVLYFLLFDEKTKINFK